MTQQCKVVGYVRVSSQGQAEDGTSLLRQREQIKAYCDSKGYEELFYLEDDGISGFKTTARKGYTQLVELCRKKKIDVVIVYDLSRISRSTEETLHFINSLCEKNKIKFVSLKDDIDSSTSTGKFMLTVLAGLNQQYRDVISEKTKEALKHKRLNQEKTGGTIPYGFTVLDGKLKPIKSEQEVIQQIKELRSKGMTLRAIAEKLTQQGVKTKTGKGSWSAKVIMKILNRPEEAEAGQTLLSQRA